MTLSQQNFILTRHSKLCLLLCCDHLRAFERMSLSGNTEEVQLELCWASLIDST